MFIQREKYILRPWQPEDSPSLAKHANNINVWNNLRDGFPHPYTSFDADSFINMAIQKPLVEDLAIIVDSNAVGGIGFVPGTDIERISAEIGYWLSETYWGEGIMSSAIKDFANYVFDNTGIIRLFATIFEFNKASERVLQKAGFNKVGILHNSAIKNGKVIDMLYYELAK